MKKDARCVFCSYVAKRDKGGRVVPSPPAVEVVVTPNGPRELCERHAREAIRA
jgi:hypothetical protein